MSLTINRLIQNIKDMKNMEEVDDVSELEDLIREEATYFVNTEGHQLGIILREDKIDDYKHLLEDPSPPEEILKSLTYKVLVDKIRQNLEEEI